MDTYTLLKHAIIDKMQVVAWYDDRLRVFCPHALGTKRDTRHVLAYQFEGESKSGLPPEGEWRCLNVDDLTEVSVRFGEWRSAPNVFNPQSCMDEIDHMVQPFPPIAPAEDRGDEAP